MCIYCTQAYYSTPWENVHWNLNFPKYFFQCTVYRLRFIQHWYARILATLLPTSIFMVPLELVSPWYLFPTPASGIQSFQCIFILLFAIKDKNYQGPNHYLVFNHFRGLHKLYYCAVDFFFKICTVQYMKTSFKIWNCNFFWVQTSMELFYQARTFDKKMKLLPKTQKLRVDQMSSKRQNNTWDCNVETWRWERWGGSLVAHHRLLRLRFWVRLRNLKMIQGLCNVKLTRESSMLGKMHC